MAMNIILGEEMHVAAFAINGVVTNEEATNLVRQLVRVIGMKTNYRHEGAKVQLQPQIWTYPLPGGGGGVGDTIIQPAFCLVQPLLESYAGAMVGADTWSEHGGWYLIINSCRRFSARKVKSHLRLMGYDVLGHISGSVSLRRSWWKRLFGR